ncbi:MAG: quinone oxidoreductase, partial [Pseudomonadota bacterium]|nr:quinone oxidoreductase [Pseudomonadota bacterium]
MGYAMAARTQGGPEVIHRIEIGEITPAAGEVVIEHQAIGINFIDIYIRTGAYPWPIDENLILGSEGAGIVTAVGEGVSHVAVGDRVGYTLPNGAYATHRAINADLVVKLPDSISSEVAAAIMLKGLTVAYLLNDSYAVKPGDTVLFHAAAGGVGLLAGQWLKSIGATAIGTAGGTEKCALAAAHGFDHVIDYRSEDVPARVMEITGGAGAAVAYDSVGKDTFAGTLASLRRHGTAVAFGQSSGPY